MLKEDRELGQIGKKVYLYYGKAYGCDPSPLFIERHFFAVRLVGQSQPLTFAVGCLRTCAYCVGAVKSFARKFYQNRPQFRTEMKIHT